VEFGTTPNENALLVNLDSEIGGWQSQVFSQRQLW